MIEKLFLNSSDNEEMDEECQRLQAQTKSNLEKLNSNSNLSSNSNSNSKDNWTKKGGKTGVLALVANNSLNTMWEHLIKFFKISFVNQIFENGINLPWLS